MLAECLTPMVARMLNGQDSTVAFYGHPGAGARSVADGTVDGAQFDLDNLTQVSTRILGRRTAPAPTFP